MSLLSYIPRRDHENRPMGVAEEAWRKVDKISLVFWGALQGAPIDCFVFMFMLLSQNQRKNQPRASKPLHAASGFHAFAASRACDGVRLHQGPCAKRKSVVDKRVTNNKI